MVVGTGVGGGGGSVRVLTSDGSTNSAMRSRPPFAGHWRLYTAFRVSTASSTDEYYKRKINKYISYLNIKREVKTYSNITMSFNMIHPEADNCPSFTKKFLNSL